MPIFRIKSQGYILCISIIPPPPLSEESFFPQKLKTAPVGAKFWESFKYRMMIIVWGKMMKMKWRKYSKSVRIDNTFMVMDNEKNTYLLIWQMRYVTIPFRAGTQRGGWNSGGWGYYLLYPPEYATVYTHPFYPFSPFSFFPHLIFFPSSPFTPSQQL